MAIEISLTGYPSGATDVYAYYVGQTLASYATDKVLFVEGTGPDTGLYTATVDESKGTSIVAFVGAAQPASWAEALVGVSWDLSNDAAEILAAIKADPQLGTADGGLVANVGKIPRAATPVTDGAAQSKRLVNESGDTLQQVHEILDGDA